MNHVVAHPEEVVSWLKEVKLPNVVQLKNWISAFPPMSAPQPGSAGPPQPAPGQQQGPPQQQGPSFAAQQPGPGQAQPQPQPGPGQPQAQTEQVRLRSGDSRWTVASHLQEEGTILRMGTILCMVPVPFQGAEQGTVVCAEQHPGLQQPRVQAEQGAVLLVVWQSRRMAALPQTPLRTSLSPNTFAWPAVLCGVAAGSASAEASAFACRPRKSWSQRAYRPNLLIAGCPQQPCA